MTQIVFLKNGSRIHIAINIQMNLNVIKNKHVYLMKMKTNVIIHHLEQCLLMGLIKILTFLEVQMYIYMMIQKWK